MTCSFVVICPSTMDQLYYAASSLSNRASRNSGSLFFPDAEEPMLLSLGAQQHDQRPTKSYIHRFTAMYLPRCIPLLMPHCLTFFAPSPAPCFFAVHRQQQPSHSVPAKYLKSPSVLPAAVGRSLLDKILWIRTVIYQVRRRHRRRNRPPWLRTSLIPLRTHSRDPQHLKSASR